MKRSIYLVFISFTLILTSCSNKTIGEINREVIPSPSSSNQPTQSPKPIPTPTKLYPTTKIDSPIAEAFLKITDLPGFRVSSPAYADTPGEQLASEERYYKCMGDQAPELARGPVKGQLEGDHFYKQFGPYLAAITSSAYFPSTKGREFINFLQNDKLHESCLIEFMQSFKGNASNTKDLTYSIVSFEDNVLTTLLSGSDTPDKPGLHFYTFYTYTEKSVLEYTVNIMGRDTAERAKLAKEMSSKLISYLIAKRNLV